MTAPLPVPSARDAARLTEAASLWEDTAIRVRSGECPDEWCACEADPADRAEHPGHECARCGRCEQHLADLLVDAAHGLVDAVVLAGLAGQVAECAESLTGAAS